MKKNNCDVSIVIVCMNNLKMLYPCLDSIRKYTTVNYETLVVAFMFSKENLAKLREDYPWVTIIESNEYRGFSENNNLALRQAKGRYCFVLNDDTYHNEPVIDELVNRFDTLSDDVAILSPNVYRPDGTIQHCGRPIINVWTYFLDCLSLFGQYEKKSKYCHQKGLFQSYNIHGACFMIKTDVFEQYGWFDEWYYFCPEDIALSTHLNRDGYRCMVDSNIRITHVGGGTWSKTLVATKPASIRGERDFYGEDGWWAKILFVIFSTAIHLLRYIYWTTIGLLKETSKRKFMMDSNLHALVATYSSKSPKELFIRYYEELKRNYK